MSTDELERALADPRTLDLLGRPASPTSVRQVRHPVSPERVVVMADEGGDGRQNSGEPEGENLSAAKLDMISRLMRVVTGHYGVPDLFPRWASGLAWRESLGSTGSGNGFGLLHQFQDDGAVQLRNAPMDWWLFLFPDGVDWDALDGKPVHGMIGHVFPPGHDQLNGLKLRVYEFTSRVRVEVARGAGHDGWQRISRLDRVAASEEVNRAVARCLSRA